MNLESQVIAEFGEQWTEYTANTGYYASLDVLRDTFGPLASVDDLKGKRVAEIGSGTGRIVSMIAEAGAERIIAIEPSAAIAPLRRNTQHLQDRITYFNEKGDSWSCPDLDYVLSIGVLHHIHEPAPSVRNAYRNLKPGGKMIVWLYGKENNRLYLALAQPLRAVTTRIPHWMLAALSACLSVPLNLYVFLCRYMKLPMRDYMLNHIKQLDQRTRRLTIYDQLNPTWAKYYTREEAEGLLKDQGFTNVRSYHRHGYSWTVIGTKPGAK